MVYNQKHLMPPQKHAVFENLKNLFGFHSSGFPENFCTGFMSPWKLSLRKRRAQGQEFCLNDQIARVNLFPVF